MSKFDRLFQAARTDEPPPATPPPASPASVPATVPSLPVAVPPAPLPVPATTSTASTAPATAPKKTAKTRAKKATPERVKVSGKRQHPEFVGLTTYVRKDVHRRVKIALLVEGKNRELSELVDELLEKWVLSKGG